MKLSELLRRADLDGVVVDALSEDLGSAVVTDLTIDSRAVSNGALFVALKGERFDGHAYLSSAFDKGAVAALTEEPLDDRCIVVADTRAALAALASAFYGYPSDQLRVCGITGTNGKTTCSFIVEAILARSRPVGVLGTVNYRWPGTVVDAPNTTPESIVTQRLLRRMLDDAVDTVVMEVSSHGLATHRVEGTHFDVVLFTNFSQDHLDFHPTMDDYFAAKLLLFTEHVRSARAASKEPVAVVNIDDQRGVDVAAAAEAAGARVVTYGRDAAAAWRAVEIRSDLDGTHFGVRWESGASRPEEGQSAEGRPEVGQKETWQLVTGLLGDFNVSNALGSLLVARELGATDDEIELGLRELDGVPGRLQRVGGRFFVDYAHTPDALETVLQTLREVVPAGGRLVVVVGAGGDRDRTKRPQMGAAASAGADLVVVTSDNPRSEDPAAIARGIVEGIDLPLIEDLGAGQGAPAGYLVELDRRRAISRVVAETSSDDVVLIAGKGHETYQEVNGVLNPFDDVAEVTRALENA